MLALVSRTPLSRTALSYSCTKRSKATSFVKEGLTFAPISTLTSAAGVPLLDPAVEEAADLLNNSCNPPNRASKFGSIPFTREERFGGGIKDG